VSGDLNTGTVPSSPARGITAQVVANTSLLIAVLVYMGWAYDNALLGYFHINPLNLDVGVVEYMLRSLSLFSPSVVIVAVGVVVVTTIRAWGLGQTRFARLVADNATTRMSAIPVLRLLVPAGDAKQAHTGRLLLISIGAVVTVFALVLAWTASHLHISTYVLLALLGGGPLLLTWPTRAARRGRFPYSLALIVAAVCVLWAASLYAQGLGTRAAQAVVRNLPSSTAADVYSVQQLALSGPGVTVQQITGRGLYHYHYEGLRLLITRSGTYYLLPVGWDPEYELTYVISESDQIRIVLYSPTVQPNVTSRRGSWRRSRMPCCGRRTRSWG
jgi:hypothetical protein